MSATVEHVPYANAIPGGRRCEHWITAKRRCRRSTRVEYIAPDGTRALCASHAPQRWQ